jgi:hypothetical protein
VSAKGHIAVPSPQPGAASVSLASRYSLCHGLVVGALLAALSFQEHNFSGRDLPPSAAGKSVWLSRATRQLMVSKRTVWDRCVVIY